MPLLSFTIYYFYLSVGQEILLFVRSVAFWGIQAETRRGCCVAEGFGLGWVVWDRLILGNVVTAFDKL